METETMTLADFLLARIAEDERAAHKLAATDHRPVLSLATTVNHPERLLLECEAKRRIVEALVDMEAVESERREQVITLRWTCRLLAMPYADHPGYLEEWHP